MKKEHRGAFDYCFDRKREISVLRWNNNAIVTVASNNVSVEPLFGAKRYDRKEKKEINIAQPAMIKNYKYMGGVDIHDNGVANYRIKIRGKKWWWPLFITMIDSAVVNAWKIQNIINEKNISQLEFRSEIVKALLLTDDCRDLTVTNTNTTNYTRYDRIDHYIIKHVSNVRRQCTFCKGKTLYLCVKCECHLHPECFIEYHTK